MAPVNHHIFSKVAASHKQGLMITQRNFAREEIGG